MGIFSSKAPKVKVRDIDARVAKRIWKLIRHNVKDGRLTGQTHIQYGDFPQLDAKETLEAVITVMNQDVFAGSGLLLTKLERLRVGGHSPGPLALRWHIERIPNKSPQLSLPPYMKGPGQYETE